MPLTSLTLSVAVPIALQSLVGFSVNMMDTVMLGQLGEVELSASSLANQVFFIVSLAVGGIADGANVLLSQAWGRGDRARMHGILAYMYRVALAFVFVVTVAAFLFPQPVLSVFSKDQEVIRQGASYLRIVSISYLFYGFSAATTGALRAVHTVKIAMAGSLLSMGVNVAGNWVLIFGNLGAPRLGIEGAAIATVLARICEAGLVLWFLWKREDKIRLKLRSLLRLDRALANAYFRTSAPVIANEFFWSLGESAIAVVLGRMGTQVVAANSICGVMNQLATVLIRGVTAAACVIVGNQIGAGSREALPRLKKYFQRIALVMGVAAGLLILLTYPAVLRFYQVGAGTLDYARQFTWITAAIQPFQALQITNMMGILRGGGDVKFAMANDMVFLWGMTVPLGFLCGLWLGFPPAAVFALLRVEKVVKAVTSELRLRNGRWIHDTLAERQTSGPLPAASQKKGK